jgi:thioredoxin reductase (NADPH)
MQPPFFCRYSDKPALFIATHHGSFITEPTNSQIAEKIGLKTRTQMAFYDLIIIGGGPAGLASAVYGALEGLHTLVVEKQAPGGQAGASSGLTGIVSRSSTIFTGD